MSKFLCLGMKLDDVVRAATATPAKAIRRDDLGSLLPGSVGDASILRLSAVHSIMSTWLACVFGLRRRVSRNRPRQLSEKAGKLTKGMGKTLEFAIVDMVAHRFKHVISDPEKAPVKTRRHL